MKKGPAIYLLKRLSDLFVHVYIDMLSRWAVDNKLVKYRSSK